MVKEEFYLLTPSFLTLFFFILLSTTKFVRLFWWGLRTLVGSRLLDVRLSAGHGCYVDEVSGDGENKGLITDNKKDSCIMVM